MSTSVLAKLNSHCIFCKIIKGEIPCYKIAETENALAFLDIGPLSPFHTLVIPKYHAERLHQLPDSFLQDILPLAKRIGSALNSEYNLLQNNGPLAHQAVNHVHFHVIPKVVESDGLKFSWNSLDRSKDQLEADYKHLSELLSSNTKEDH